MFMTLVLIIALLALGSLFLTYRARQRAERRAAEASLARRVARKSRVPRVSNNVKGVTASQTIDPYQPSDRPDVRANRAA
jgi:hypothetical protein